MTSSPTPNVSLRAVPEHDAVAASESRPDFSVLVGLRAPSLSADASRYSQTAPVDLVAVLDVSGSMKGHKIDLVKRAVGFVVNHLGPNDRFSVVTFNNVGRIIYPLAGMTELGRAGAKRAVDSIQTGSGTNILEGLKTGARVLEGRLLRNPVTSVMFLSDGQDNSTNGLTTKPASEYLPASMTIGVVSVHTFGFGSDHNPVVMHAISDESGGTFSFIESYETVQAAFARCIGGLLSVVTQELRLTLKSASPGVTVKHIPSGKHTSDISNQESVGTIIVGDLYADEEKEFLINTSVPAYTTEFGEDETTQLLDITCSYKDVHSNETVLLEFVEIQRPGVPLPSDVKVKLEVDRERNRLDAAEGFAEAHRAAEGGDFTGARDILSKKRSAILASESGQAGDLLVVKVEKEMREAEERMVSKKVYEEAGRACALSSISAHSNQRATTNIASSSCDSYVTPNMANMVCKSRARGAKKVAQKNKKCSVSCSLDLCVYVP